MPDLALRPIFYLAAIIPLIHFIMVAHWDPIGLPPRIQTRFTLAVYCLIPVASVQLISTVEPVDLLFAVSLPVSNPSKSPGTSRGSLISSSKDNQLATFALALLSLNSFSTT